MQYKEVFYSVRLLLSQQGKQIPENQYLFLSLSESSILFLALSHRSYLSLIPVSVGDVLCYVDRTPQGDDTPSGNL